MQEREQKWYSGMLGVTFNANEGSPSQNNPSSAVNANRGEGKTIVDGMEQNVKAGDVMIPCF